MLAAFGILPEPLCRLVLRMLLQRWYKGRTAAGLLRPGRRKCADARPDWGARCSQAGAAPISNLSSGPPNFSRESFNEQNRFVNAIADQAELTKADAGRAIDAMVEVVKKALKKGDSVSLVGFGTFTVRKRAARTGRNPRTGRDDQDQGFEGGCLQGRQGPQGRHQLKHPAVGCLAQR